MTDTNTDSGKKLFFGLFIFPLLIAVGMAVLLCTVVLMTHEKETPENLIAALKKSAPSKRWQKAFELSNEINRAPEKVRDPAIHREMIEILRDADRFDAKTRSYMAVALSHAYTPEAFEALERALDDHEETVRAYALWSLGLAGRKEAAARIETKLRDDSAEVRKTAAYVLGGLSSLSSADPLKNSLKDPVTDVRWNAALALARLGDADGYNVLLSMLDRAKLERDLKLDERQIESAMTNAMKGLVLIPKVESVKILETISKEDRNMRIRQASIDSLDHLKKTLT